MLRALEGAWARLRKARRRYRPVVKGIGRLRLRRMTVEERFTWIYQRNLWRSPTSISGRGSDLAQTEAIRRALPVLIRAHEVRVLLDIPCGDCFWLAHTDLGALDRYIGADIVVDLSRRNYLKENPPDRPACSFLHLDLTRDALPPADMILCRDCLVHLSLDDIGRALENIARSQARYLLMTQFTGPRDNVDILSGDWRPLNFERAPFGFPAPLQIVKEDQGGSYADKSLALWRLADLPLKPAGAAARPQQQP